MMFDRFDHKTLQEMFDGKEVSPVLPYESIDADRDTVTASTQASGRISISGVQPKDVLMYSLMALNGFKKILPLLPILVRTRMERTINMMR